MRIVDPQSAVLTNIEVLAYVTANPPRRPPNPPPNSRNWVPSPDLRDHNTVVKELQPYGLTKGEVLMIVNLGVGVQGPGADAPGEGEEGEAEGTEEGQGEEGEEGAEEGGEEMTNGTAAEAQGEEMDVDAVEGGGEEGGEEVPEEDYGPLALLDTVIEERDERLSDEDVRAVLAIIRETLGGGQ
ncbi:hypothetical protein N8T08_009850 [Aspergillus melleus]|uniref:Uncharacterized protein n=1 Tax=Aspergillus melleus TaxID=138277 RepID=A0ACC3ASW3_9EURO|nr:hypothetical protein N8T08_009850 [Aspergillus melleus]